MHVCTQDANPNLPTDALRVLIIAKMIKQDTYQPQTLNFCEELRARGAFDCFVGEFSRCVHAILCLI